MARIQYGTTTDNRLTTSNGSSNLSVVGNEVEYLVYNPNNESLKLDFEAQNDLVIELSVTSSEGSRHTGGTTTDVIVSDSLTLDPMSYKHITVMATAIDAEAGDNVVQITASGIHTDRGLTGNLIYIARIVDTTAGFNSAI